MYGGGVDLYLFCVEVYGDLGGGIECFYCFGDCVYVVVVVYVLDVECDCGYGVCRE